MKRTYLINLMLLVATVVYGQDTLYFDANNKKAKSMDLCATYKITKTDPKNVYQVTEYTYFKSGKIKSEEPFIISFNKNTDSQLVKAYESGKIQLTDQLIQYKFSKKIHGTYKEWYENGQLRKVIEFNSGVMNGQCLTYWDNREPKRIERFEKGKSIGGKCFDKDGNEIKYYDFEKMPEFPGGNQAMFHFLSQNIRYPISMMENGKQGMVITQFVIQKDGSLTELKIRHSLDPDGDREALRVVSLSPKWIPGMQDGEPVPVSFTLPIKFSIK